jgi:hypothetical protein
MPPARTALCLAGLIGATAAGAQDAAPTLECSRGFDAIKTDAQALPGAQVNEHEGFEIFTQAAPGAWRAEFFFTTGWHPAYPAVALRTQRKQVTGVWTADSKVCGYGSSAQTSALADEMKTGDKALTDASRAEVERKKSSRSPLSPP